MALLLHITVFTPTVDPKFPRLYRPTVELRFCLYRFNEFQILWTLIQAMKFLVDVFFETKYGKDFVLGYNKRSTPELLNACHANNFSPESLNACYTNTGHQF